jgi:hypothetical protein
MIIPRGFQDVRQHDRPSAGHALGVALGLVGLHHAHLLERVAADGLAADGHEQMTLPSPPA